MLQIRRSDSSRHLAPADSKDKFELSFALGLLAIAGVTFISYWKTNGVGFLLDDYLHIRYLHDAMLGHPAELLKRMYSAWSYTTDGMKAYRPGLTLSFLFDYALLQGQAFGMHLTNVFLSVAASVFVALTAVELSLAFQLRHRHITALAAALLFAAYPLHPEATAWIADRADVLGSALYLASVWAFLRFCRTQSQATFVFSLVSFFFSLTVKEVTVTLPVVITLIALIVRRDAGWKKVGAYWALLAAFATLRAAVIGQLIGGYGDGGRLSIRQIAHTFFDKDTIFKILFGATEEMDAPSYLRTCNFMALGVIGVLGFASTIKSSPIARLYLFLTAWTVATVLPAFQIWHIYPNLNGSRIFYVGSAPLCMILAFAALGPVLTANKNRIVLPAGLVALALLASVWLQVLQINLIPWTVAGQHMARLREQVQAIAASVPQGRRALLVNIPQDYKGVPMLGRPEFLEEICRPPYCKDDLSARVFTVQRPVNGGQDYIYPELLQQIRKESTSTYVWNGTTGNYTRLQGTEQPNQNDTQQPLVAVLGPDEQAASARSKSPIKVESGCVEVRMGPTPVILWLSLGKVNPRAITSVELKTSGDTQAGIDPKLPPTLMWQPADGSSVQNAAPCYFRSGSYYYLPARQKSWTLLPEIDKIGFSIPPGKGTVKLSGIGLSNNSSSIVPITNISISPDRQNDRGYELWLTTVDSKSTFAFDANGVPGCTGVKLFITKAWHAFDDIPSEHDPLKQTLAFTTSAQETKGTFNIPKDVLGQSGVHQITAMPLDKFGHACGVMSEPRSFIVESRKAD